MSAQILELKDCTEVAEVLLAKPSRGIRFVLITLMLLLVTAAGWAYFTKLSLVVRAPGRVRPVT